MSSPRTKLAAAHNVQGIHRCTDYHGPRYPCSGWKMRVRVTGAGSIVVHVRYQDISDPLGRPRSRLSTLQAEVALENAY